jgi:hypothetical protein
MTTAGGSGTSAVAANTIYFLPFYLGPAVVDRIGIEVTAFSAGNARLGLYRNAGGLPTSLILDCGTVSTSGNAIVEATFTALTLPDEAFWAAVVFDATPTCRNGSTVDSTFFGASAFSSAQRGLFGTLTYGVLPASAPAITGLSAAAPIVSLRKS